MSIFKTGKLALLEKQVFLVFFLKKVSQNINRFGWNLAGMIFETGFQMALLFFDLASRGMWYLARKVKILAFLPAKVDVLYTCRIKEFKFTPKQYEVPIFSP